MNKKSKIESKFSLIAENYKSEFSSKFQKINSFLDTMKSKYSLLNEMNKSLSKELMDVANKFYNDNSLSCKTELDELIKNYYLEFVHFAQNA